uniref:Uncharacterized protein n=1 Tax=Avena sativa TaxID=4498 RepID=A0ACD5Y8H9_AVESA
MMGFVAIIGLLCLFHSPHYATIAESTYAHYNVPILQKGATRAGPPHIQLARRDKRPSGEFDDDNITGQYAVWQTTLGKYYGLQAKIGVWAHRNQEHLQASGASIAVTNAKRGSSFSMFEAGFHVFPELYNNSDVHFFTFWTRDGYGSTGCYNLRCSGFVPADGVVLVPGKAVGPPSTYDGEDRYITISLHTDPNTGNWLLYRKDLEKSLFLGHFRKDICLELNDGAPQASFIGSVSYPKNGTAPAMGSGHFPKEGERKAAYFKNMTMFDSNAKPHDPIPSIMVPWMSKRDCYRISDIPLGTKDGYMFYYGGPEGCSG